MKISRKPKIPTRSNPPKLPVAPSNRMVKTEDIKQVLDSDMIEKQWKYYTSTGDSTTISTKEEDVWEYHERRTGKVLVKPIITVDETRGKTDDESEKLATGHGMNLEGFNHLQKRTALFLYVTGQKEMANKMIVNILIQMRNLKNASNTK